MKFLICLLYGHIWKRYHHPPYGYTKSNRATTIFYDNLLRCKRCKEYLFMNRIKNKRPYIAFCGSSSTGKSTVAEEIKRFFSNMLKKKVVMLDGIPRLAAKDKLNEKGDEDTQHKIEKMFMDIEEKHWAEPIISTRSIVDRFAYTRANKLNRKVMKFYRELIPSTLDKYTILFYIPVEDHVPLVLDGVRSVDKKYRDKVDKIIKKILKEYDSELPLMIELRGTIDDRVATAKKVIRMMYGKGK